MVPKLTAEQRRAALDKGMQIRIKRAEYKAKLKNGLMSIEQFFELADGGDQAALVHLHQNVWEKDGKRYRKLEVIVDNVAIMTSHRQSQQPAAVPQAATYPDVYDEDIPF